MIFTFTYEGTAYDFDDERMGLTEARWLKNQFGFVGTDFYEACRKLDPEALIGLLVLAMRRAGVRDVEVETLFSKDNDNSYMELVESMEVRAAGPPPGPRALVKVKDSTLTVDLPPTLDEIMKKPVRARKVKE